MGDQLGAGEVELDGGDVLAALFAREYRSLVGLARLLVDDGREAEEVVQEAFTNAYASWHRIERKGEPLRYVRRIVVNVSRGRLRRRGVARRALLAPPEPAPAAEDEHLAEQRRRDVFDAIVALPSRQRECVALRYYLDCSTDETATILGVSTGTVKTHLHRALAAIEQRLEESP